MCCSRERRSWRGELLTCQLVRASLPRTRQVRAKSYGDQYLGSSLCVCSPCSARKITAPLRRKAVSERDECGGRLGSPLFLPVRITLVLDLVRTRAIGMLFITLEAPAMSRKILISETRPCAQHIWLLKTSCFFVVLRRCQQLPMFNDVGELIAMDARNIVVAF